MKKVAGTTAALLATAGLILAPSAEAADASTPSPVLTDTNATSPIQDETAPGLTFYTGAMGDMLNCGGFIGRLWCKK